MVLALATPTMSFAVGPNRWERSPKVAAETYWLYSRCVVKRKPEAVAQLLSSWVWSKEEYEAAEELAQRSGRWCLIAGDRLRFPPKYFQGTLGAAVLEAKYRDQAPPDYSSVPLQFTQSELDLYTSSKKWTAKIVMLVMAECVYRHRTDQVLKLFASKPFSDKADAQWQELNPVLGKCLPLTEGKQIRFDGISLRAYLGEAGYAVDKAFEDKSETSLSAN